MQIDHDALKPGNVAVVTGGASGIGLACAHSFASHGMRVCLADTNAEELADAAASIDGAIGVHTDVADRSSVEALAKRVRSELGHVSVLMNNAGTGGGGDALSNPEGWERVLGTNLFGVLHGVQTFVPEMAESGRPGLVVNTGSKQGITTPPGDTSYNVSKAGIKVLTEGLAHTLRTMDGCRVTAHLLVPGFTFTGMMRKRLPEKPPSAWEPEQVAQCLLKAIDAGEFYVICEDNETTEDMDHKRITWAVQDMIENRPALSRWHPDWKERFEAFMANPLKE